MGWYGHEMSIPRNQYYGMGFRDTCPIVNRGIVKAWAEDVRTHLQRKPFDSFMESRYQRYLQEEYLPTFNALWQEEYDRRTLLRSAISPGETLLRPASGVMPSDGGELLRGAGTEKPNPVKGSASSVLIGP